MQVKNIIFDFDGTLIDSRPGIVASFKKTIEELTFKQANEQRIAQLIGAPLTQIISVLLDTDDQKMINQGSELFKKYYDEEGIYQNIVYPGIEDMLIVLKNQSCQLFIVSNKIELFIKKILKQHNLEKYFIYIRGTDGRDEKSKKAEYIKEIIKKYKLKNQEITMIGDTENDIIAGKGNSIYAVGITWGYGTEADLIKAGADIICHTSLELQQFIEKYENRKTN